MPPVAPAEPQPQPLAPVPQPPTTWQEAEWRTEGLRASSVAMTLAVIGFFFAGFVLGLFALHHARIARARGCPNKRAETLAWVDIGGWALIVILPFILYGWVAVFGVLAAFLARAAAR